MPNSMINVEGVNPEDSSGALSRPFYNVRSNNNNINNKAQGKRVPFGNTSAIQLYSNSDLYKQLQIQLNRLWNIKHYKPKLAADTPLFAAPQPITCSKQVYEEQLKNCLDDWWVTDKSNGTRFCLFITALEHYVKKYIVFNNRQKEMYLVEFKLPEALYDGTLFDGELIAPVDSTNQWSFRLSDVIFSCGNDLRFYAKSDRLTVIDQLLLDIEWIPNKSPCKVTNKPWRPAKELRHFIDEFHLTYLLEAEQDKQQHTSVKGLSDGLIFERESAPILPFTSTSIIKWKPFLWNTSDFLFKVVTNQTAETTNANAIIELFALNSRPDTTNNNNSSNLCLSFHSQQQIVETFEKDQNNDQQRQSSILLLPVDTLLIHNRIFECIKDLQTNKWRPIAQRTDKPYPNHIKVIRDNEDLLYNPVLLGDIIAQSKLYTPQTIDTMHSPNHTRDPHSFEVLATSKPSDLIKSSQIAKQANATTYDYQSTWLAQKQRLLSRGKQVPVGYFYQMTAPDNIRAIAPQTTEDATCFNLMTKYERARAIGARATQLALGANSTIELGNETDPIEIAGKELLQEKCPIRIARPFPNGQVKILNANRLYLA